MTCRISPVRPRGRCSTKPSLWGHTATRPETETKAARPRSAMPRPACAAGRFSPRCSITGCAVRSSAGCAGRHAQGRDLQSRHEAPSNGRPAQSPHPRSKRSLLILACRKERVLAKNNLVDFGVNERLDLSRVHVRIHARVCKPNSQ
jgi:hypothetical protein